jgi:alpha-glucuronidase
MLHLIAYFLVFGLAAAESGVDGWLRYAKLPRNIVKDFRPPTDIIVLNQTATGPVSSAGTELQHGLSGIFSLNAPIS